MPTRTLTPEELAAREAKLKTAKEYILNDGKTAQEAIALVQAARAEETPAPETTTTTTLSPENPA